MHRVRIVAIVSWSGSVIEATALIRDSSRAGRADCAAGPAGMSSSRALRPGHGARSSVRVVGGEDAGVEGVASAEEQRWADRYGLLFILILMSLVLSAANTTWLKVVGVLLQGGMVLFACLAARAGRHAWRIAIVLVPIGVILGIAGRIGESQPAELVAAIVSVVLPATAIVVLARRIAREPFVSGRTVLGLLSVYLLIGMTFSATYVTIAVASDEPFFVQTEQAEPVDFTYFSFVTLATVGYGDFTAANPMPRMLAAIEGLTGQLYLVTVVAVAVSRVRTRRDPPPGG